LIQFSLGQRWISNAEPELGMGQVFSVDNRQVTVYFPISGTSRTYSQQQAPLTRVRFSPGDRIESDQGWTLEVSSITEVDDLIVYYGLCAGEEKILIETSLKDEIRFNKPQDRLFTHQIDANDWFDLRYQTMTHHARLAQSTCRGLYGPRVALIPHQLYISNEVAHRFSPRVLLADEVGLGKTIEAGLIIHQQIHTGRASRILIIVPKALTFQWFVEMIRRFNLQLAILDEERCKQIQHDNMEADEILASEDEHSDETEEEPTSFNPFHAQQLVLCSLDLFTEHPHRVQQAVEGEWDLLVVDEVHHLSWSPSSVSREYRVIEQLTKAIKGVLLLTATPEQLGKTGHFARLRLLDPDRFYSLDRFLQEEGSYQPIAEFISELIDVPDLNIAEKIDAFTQRTGIQLSTTVSSTELIQQLLDRHGTGRILFRNIRSSVSGFSQRILRATPLPFPNVYEQRLQSGSLTELLYPENHHSGSGNKKWVQVDPRIPWLVELLRKLKQKVLIICANSSTAVELEDNLKHRHGINSALFHEGMDLVGRDRAAAYFADPDDGAQVLVCSEIGSEGRNFQFSQHLVLFDLPPNPDLVEQRIGRLDRIGQTRDVIIHLPYLSNSPHEVLYRYYHEGLNLFVEANPAAQSIFPDSHTELEALMLACIRTGKIPAQLDQFILETAKLNLDKKEMLSRGRDRLLELNSHRSEVSDQIIREILGNEGGETLQHYMNQACEMYGLEMDPLDKDIYLLKPTESMVRHVAVSMETQQRYRFPELPEDGVRITFDRTTALSREDVMFMSWENPMVTQAIDLVMTDLLGNCCITVTKHPSFQMGTLLVETLHQVHAVAPAELQIHRYLPPKVLRSLINAENENIAEQHVYQSFQGKEIKINPVDLFKIIDSQAAGLKSMIGQADLLAGEALKQVKSQAMDKMTQHLQSELQRLTELGKVNPNIRSEEIEFLHSARQQLAQAIQSAGLRQDAIRVIIAA